MIQVKVAEKYFDGIILWSHNDENRDPDVWVRSSGADDKYGDRYQGPLKGKSARSNMRSVRGRIQAYTLVDWQRDQDQSWIYLLSEWIEKNSPLDN